MAAEGRPIRYRSRCRQESDCPRTVSATLLGACAGTGGWSLRHATGMPRNNINQLLFKMAKAGEVQKVRRGRYIHLDRADLSDRNQDPDKKDKKITNPRYGDDR
jgi:hypothetical protein